MKIYTKFNGDNFTVAHHMDTSLSEYVDGVWLDIQDRELTLLYKSDVDIMSKIQNYTNVEIDILDVFGNVLEKYTLDVEEVTRACSRITYKINTAHCHFCYF